MAAYLANAGQWDRFERRLAKLQSRYGFSIFHGKDFRRRVGDFRGWSDRKCEDLVRDLTNATYRLEQGVTIALSRDRYLSEYRSSPIPKKMLIDSQCGACFRACLGHLLKTMIAKGGGARLSIVIESGHKNDGDCLRIFQDVKKRHWRLGHNMLGKCTIASKKECQELMLADFLSGAYSKLRDLELRGEVDRSTFSTRMGGQTTQDYLNIKKGSIAIIEHTPTAFTDLKREFAEIRQKEIEMYMRQRKVRLEIDRGLDAVDAK